MSLGGHHDGCEEAVVYDTRSLGLGVCLSESCGEWVSLAHPQAARKVVLSLYLLHRQMADVHQSLLDICSMGLDDSPGDLPSVSSFENLQVAHDTVLLRH